MAEGELLKISSVLLKLINSNLFSCGECLLAFLQGILFLFVSSLKFIRLLRVVSSSQQRLNRRADDLDAAASLCQRDSAISCGKE